MSPREKNKLLHGTLDTLILRTLHEGPLHGYAVARWIEARASDAIKVEEGSLYPALYRLEKKGLVASEWGLSELGRKAKFYRLTERGREQLDEETARWKSFSAAVSKVLASS